MTIPDHELPRADPNGSRLRIPALRWPTVVTILLVGGLSVQTWMVRANIDEWAQSRETLNGIVGRVAADRDTLRANNERMINELRLQTFNQMLPASDQQRLLPTLVSRLDEATRRQVLSLKLRSLQVIGEQQSTGLEDLRLHRRQAP